MLSRVLCRPIVFIRVLYSILILLIKIFRCSIPTVYGIGYTVDYSTTQKYPNVPFWLNYLIKLEYTTKMCYQRREYCFEGETCRHTMLSVLHTSIYRTYSLNLKTITRNEYLIIKCRNLAMLNIARTPLSQEV